MYNFFYLIYSSKIYVGVNWLIIVLFVHRKFCTDAFFELIKQSDSGFSPKFRLLVTIKIG